MLTEFEHGKIFSNIESLKKSHLLILKVLHKIRKDEQTGEASKPLEMLESLIPDYCIFAACQSTSIKILADCAQRPNIKAHLEKKLKLTECRGMTLGSLLIKPILRFVRYPFYTEELYARPFLCIC